MLGLFAFAEPAQAALTEDGIKGKVCPAKTHSKKSCNKVGHVREPQTKKTPNLKLKSTPSVYKLPKLQIEPLDSKIQGFEASGKLPANFVPQKVCQPCLLFLRYPRLWSCASEPAEPQSFNPTCKSPLRQDLGCRVAEKLQAPQPFYSLQASRPFSALVAVSRNPRPNSSRR